MSTFKYTSMSQVRRNLPNFFSQGNNRFFNSRYGSILFGGTYFITSEKYHSEPRLYTVRRVVQSESGDYIETVGDFQGYTTYAKASKIASALAQKVSE